MEGMLQSVLQHILKN